MKIFLKTFAVLLVFFLALPVLGMELDQPPALYNSQQNDLKIISVSKGGFWGTDVFVSGKGLPNTTISLSIKDHNDMFAYSIRANSDANGNWFANFDQLLKSDTYYIEASEQETNSQLIESVKSAPIEIKGSFAVIVNVFSMLVVILLIGFVGGWYINKLAEIKRYRRILMSQRDIVSSYNVLKNDVDRADEILKSNKDDKWKVTETEFFIKRLGENLEKMNKYVVQGVNIISKYDIITKINNYFKIKK